MSTSRACGTSPTTEYPTPKCSGDGRESAQQVVYCAQDTSTDTQIQETEFGGVLTIVTTTVTRTITERLLGSDEEDSDAEEIEEVLNGRDSLLTDRTSQSYIDGCHSHDPYGEIPLAAVCNDGTSVSGSSSGYPYRVRQLSSNTRNSHPTTLQPSFPEIGRVGNGPSSALSAPPRTHGLPAKPASLTHNGANVSRRSDTHKTGVPRFPSIIP